jgi:hypothetical protein
VEFGLDCGESMSTRGEISFSDWIVAALLIACGIAVAAILALAF